MRPIFNTHFTTETRLHRGRAGRFRASGSSVSARSNPGRRRAISILLALVVCSLGCPKYSEPGMKRYQKLAVLDLPLGVKVNVAGGGLHLSRSDLSVDTFLGTYAIQARFNSAQDGWIFDFETTYDGEVFVDGAGTIAVVKDFPNHSEVPGTHWVKVDNRRMKTAGGMTYEFREDGTLSSMYWAGQKNQQRLEFSSSSIIQVVAGQASPLFYIQKSGGRISRIVNQRDQSTARYLYDDEGRITQAWSGLDNQAGSVGSRYVYSENAFQATTPEGASFTASLINNTVTGLRGRVAQVRYHGSGDPSWSFSYGEFGQNTDRFWTTTTDPDGYETRHHYDQKGRVSRVDHPMGLFEEFEWDAANPFELARHVDRQGLATVFQRATNWIQIQSPSQKMRVTFTPVSSNAHFREAPKERPASRVEIDDAGWRLVSANHFGSGGRLTATENGEGEAKFYYYDPGNGAINRVQDPDDIVKTYSDWGSHGHPQKITMDDSSTSITYDAVGNRTKTGFVTPDSPGVSEIQYDAGRNPHRRVLTRCSANTIEPCGGVIVQAFRSDGQLWSITRPGGGNTVFDYDALGRMVGRSVRVASHDEEKTFFSYDRLGRLTATHQENGMRSETDYDALGRVVKTASCRAAVGSACEASPEVYAHYSWAKDRVYRVYGSGGLNETYGYDAQGRARQVAYYRPGAASDKVTLEYDARSRVSARSLLEGSQSLARLEFEYDEASRITRVDAQTGAGPSRLLVQDHRQDGHLVARGFGNGLYRFFEYEDGKVKSSILQSGNGDRVAGISPIGWTNNFFWNSSLGHRGEAVVSGSETESSEQWLFSGGNQFGSHQVVGYETDDCGGDHVIAYDALANFSFRLSSGTGLCSYKSENHSYNAYRNRLESVVYQGGEEARADLSYDYDASGFVTRRGDDSLTWAADGRLRSFGPVGSEVGHVVLGYDGLGRPTSRSVSGVAVLDQGFRFGGQVTERTNGDLELDLRFMRLSLSGQTDVYRHLDRRGNVKFLTDSEGEVLTHYHYGGWGLTSIDGNGWLDADHRFAQGLDLGKIMILGARVYDPEVGRFLSPDPIHQAMNQYTYTPGNPVDLWDPTGLCWELLKTDEFWLVAGVLVWAANPPAAGLGSGLMYLLGINVAVAGYIATNLPSDETPKAPESAPATPSPKSTPAPISGSSAGGLGAMPSPGVTGSAGPFGSGFAVPRPWSSGGPTGSMGMITVEGEGWFTQTIVF